MAVIIPIILLYFISHAHGDLFEIFGENPPDNMNDLATFFGYQYENYTVRTSDGYYLTLGRLPSPKDSSSCPNRNETAVISHGALGNGEQSLAYKHTLGYKLADSCYDVWILNLRGTKYSSHHQKLLPSDRDFWAFDGETLALRDLKESLDFIRANTKRDKLDYVGFSLSSMLFWILSTLEPNYQVHFKTAHLVCPIGWLIHPKNQNKFILKATMVPEIVNIAYPDDIQSLLLDVAFEACKIRRSNFLCQLAIAVGELPEELLMDYMFRFPDRTSRRVYGGAFQFIDPILRRYNWGSARNKQLYGTSVPPAYNLSLVSTPIYIYDSTGDTLASPKNVDRLVSHLKTVVSRHTIHNDNITHLHMALSNDPSTPDIANLVASNLNRKTSK